jgi:hypothetical protein
MAGFPVRGALCRLSSPVCFHLPPCGGALHSAAQQVLPIPLKLQQGANFRLLLFIRVIRNCQLRCCCVEPPGWVAAGGCSRGGGVSTAHWLTSARSSTRAGRFGPYLCPLPPGTYGVAAADKCDAAQAPCMCNRPGVCCFGAAVGCHGVHCCCCWPQDSKEDTWLPLLLPATPPAAATVRRPRCTPPAPAAAACPAPAPAATLDSPAAAADMEVSCCNCFNLERRV